MVIGLRLYSLFNDSEPTERGFLDVMGSLSQTPVRCLKKKKKKITDHKTFCSGRLSDEERTNYTSLKEEPVHWGIVKNYE